MMILYSYKRLLNYKSIRDKIDLIKLILNIYTVANLSAEKNATDVTIFFQTENGTNRIYIFEDETLQIQSFHSPFILKDDEGKFLIKLENSIFTDNIDEGVIALLKSFFNNYVEYDSEFEAFMTEFMDIDDTILGDFGKMKAYWNLVLYLLSFDAGYFRYDYDSENANGNLHPLYHIDINYTDNASYKLGLRHAYNCKDLISLVSKVSGCKYIE